MIGIRNKLTTGPMVIFLLSLSFNLTFTALARQVYEFDL